MGTVIALGGGGFAMSEGRSALDVAILARSGRPRPRVCFVPTASADSATYLVRFYRAFAALDCVASDLCLHGAAGMPRRPAASADLAGFVADQDVIYVGGGNTANLLATWRTHGLDAILRAAHARGSVLCGMSAGMLCWFAGGVTDSFGPLDALADGLGLIAASACPHYDGEPGRRPRYHALIASGALGDGYAADDGAALVFEDGALAEVLCERPGAQGYRVERAADGGVRETAIRARPVT